MEPLRCTYVARFGTFEVSFASGEMRRAGLKIRVQQQPLKLLQLLLEQPEKSLPGSICETGCGPMKALATSTRPSTS
jgi:hypothetical protein